MMNSILDISVIWFCATWPMEGPNRLHLNYNATRRCCLHRDDKVRAIRLWCHVVQVRDPWRFLLPLLKVFVNTPTVVFTYFTSAVSEGVRYYADGGSLHVRYSCCSEGVRYYADCVSYLQSVIDAVSCSQCLCTQLSDTIVPTIL